MTDAAELERLREENRILRAMAILLAELADVEATIEECRSSYGIGGKAWE